MSNRRRYPITCLRCGRCADNCGRGLCGTCYNLERKRGSLAKYGRHGGTAEEYLAALQGTKTDDECWTWPGAIRHDGYGRPGRKGLAHRWVWQRMIGPIPDGMELDHMCHNLDETCTGGPTCKHRACVNPNHLRIVTHAMNGIASPHTVSGKATRRETCVRGHRYTMENTYRTSNGWRVCRTCNIEKLRALRARRASA